MFLTSFTFPEKSLNKTLENVYNSLKSHLYQLPSDVKLLFQLP